MSALDPSGPSQFVLSYPLSVPCQPSLTRQHRPNVETAYTTPGNPASKDPTEQKQATHRSLDGSQPIDQRIPNKQASEDRATSSSLGRGIRGAGAGEEGKGLTSEDVGRHRELDAEQMAAPGEGDVADAVAGRGRGGNVGGEQVDLAADLDR